jgi:cytochrome c peroxidase
LQLESHRLVMTKRTILPAIAILAISGPALADSDLADLGRMLFFDTQLSLERTQSCSSCHDPARAFSDPGTNDLAGAVSLGGDGVSLGDRNAPPLTYAHLTPAFFEIDGEYSGGLFLDGRATNLVEQAEEPILNPIEMALPNARALRERVRENPAYVELFERSLGPGALASSRKALHSVATAIAAFESTAEFASFDSKYDRHLRGEIELTRDEELGRILFFSNLVNCNQCHALDTRESRPGEVFTNYRYHNIGLPVNRDVRAANGLGKEHVDTGLLQNPAVRDRAQAGRFRVPSLRNVAVTGPYMHNGVFEELETAIIFYNKYLVGNEASRTNPETGQPWGDAEVPRSVDLELLGAGQPLTDKYVKQLVAFLKTLTDQRYEHLLR